MNKFVICGKSFIACKSAEYSFDAIKIKHLGLALHTVPVSNDTGIDTWQPSLLKLSRRLGLTAYPSLSSCDLEKGDIVISLEYDRVVQNTELNGARAYNLHFSNLPKYRGCLTSVWPIRNGEKRAGVTLHELTPDVDAGPIIDQILFDIPEFMTSFDLYRNYSAYAYELYKKHFVNLAEGTTVSSIQDSSAATYYKRSSVDYRDTELLDFKRPCIEMRNYVRSLIFEPYQLPVFHGRRIIDCDVIASDRKGEGLLPPAQVIIEDREHAVVSCMDGYIRLSFSVRQ